MESKDTKRKVKEQKKSKLINSRSKLKKLRSDYFIQKCFNYISERKSLEIIKYNKNIQKRINIDINNYRNYSEKYSSIEIEIIPIKNKYGEFIFIKENEKEYYSYIF